MMRKIIFALALGLTMSAMGQVLNVTSIEKVNLPGKAAVAAISPLSELSLPPISALLEESSSGIDELPESSVTGIIGSSTPLSVSADTPTPGTDAHANAVTSTTAAANVVILFIVSTSVSCNLSKRIPSSGILSVIYTSAITSTSTRTSLGSSFTATQERAGLEVKYSP